jgi:hypothetical protein
MNHMLSMDNYGSFLSEECLEVSPFLTAKFKQALGEKEAR